jgi:hypothetical protein
MSMHIPFKQWMAGLHVQHHAMARGVEKIRLHSPCPVFVDLVLPMRVRSHSDYTTDLEGQARARPAEIM